MAKPLVETNIQKMKPLIQPIDLESIKALKFNLDDLEMHQVKPTDILDKPSTAIAIYNNEDGDDFAILGTLGNFSLFIGKAKARKTFFLGIVIASAISDMLVFNTYKALLKPNQSNVLYFDTEQSKYHVLLAIKRICKIAKIDNPKNLIAYSLRPEV